ncbi:hypothetical protein Tco_0900632 [Tanacetum coccineum]
MIGYFTAFHKALSTVLINNLNASNHLHTNPNDSTSTALIPFKLLVIMESLVKKKQKGAILELKRTTFEEYYFLHLYAVSSNEDMAYQRQLSTRNA